MPDKRPPLLILGASTRSAAHSAARAGFRPICADMFADEDLRATAEILPLDFDKYPHDLVRVAALAPPCPWMYTGAIENYPDLVREISAVRPLWGNSPDAIQRIRDPAFVHAALTSAGLPVPSVRPASDPPPADGTWMLKPDRSGGGRGIRVWNEKAADCATLQEPHWFQKRIEGELISALLVACAGRSALIGATRQNVGTKSQVGPTHGYCGSIGPIELSAAERAPIARLGDALAGAAELRGVFGVDGLWNDQGFWPVDINPRYTASVEVLEHAYEVPSIAWHSRACEPGASGLMCDELEQSLPPRPKRYGAKTILFARRNLVIPRLADLFPARGESPQELPALADRPAPGTKISEGKPICSVFGWGPSEQECRDQLANRIEQVSKLLYGNQA